MDRYTNKLRLLVAADDLEKINRVLNHAYASVPVDIQDRLNSIYSTPMVSWPKQLRALAEEFGE